MNPGLVNLVCPQGATFQKVLTYKIGRSPVNITGWTARMQVRENYESDSILLDITTANNGITLGGVTGTVTLNASSATTSGFRAGVYVYDLELISANGTVIRLIEGRFTVTPEVTR
jgi:hypothetical protein